MDYILIILKENIELLWFSFIFSVVYIVLAIRQGEPLKGTILSAICGFLSAPLLAPPIAAFMGHDSFEAWYAGGIALCGQFVPQLIQSTIKVLNVDMLINKFFGGRKNDN